VNASDVIAIGALLVSVLSFLVSIFSYRSTLPKIRVTTELLMPVRVPPPGEEFNAVTEKWLHITAENYGHVAIQVRSIRFETVEWPRTVKSPDGRDIPSVATTPMIQGDPLHGGVEGPALPARLQAYESAEWKVLVDDEKGWFGASQPGFKFVVSLLLGNGRHVRSKTFDLS
jgi:hypothetical protein